MESKRINRFRHELRASRWRIGPWFLFIGVTGQQAYCWHSISEEYYGVLKNDGFFDQILDSMEASGPFGYGAVNGPDGCDAIIPAREFHRLFGSPDQFTDVESWRSIPNLLG